MSSTGSSLRKARTAIVRPCTVIASDTTETLASSGAGKSGGPASAAPPNANAADRTRA